MHVTPLPSAVAPQDARRHPYRTIGWDRAEGPGDALGDEGVIEAASDSSRVVARVEGTGGQEPLHLRSLALGTGRCRALVPRRGTLEAHMASGTHRLPAGSILIVDGDIPIDLQASGDAAWIEWQLPSPSFPPGTPPALPFALADGMSQLIASLTASLIEKPPENDGQGAPFLTRALSHVLISAVADEPGASSLP
ncbi:MULTISPECIES: hypothetical protein [Bacteria]|uniref:hypothetical protein n=1 Tax=Bacteria TaxID=2 RepID=UPI003C7AC89D